MKPIRHRSPNYKNTYSENFFKSSPNINQANIINFDNKKDIINHSSNKRTSFNNNNYLSFSYNKDNYNYYEEITNAFNFITYVLKQKDSQIQELKLKIKDLEKQLNDINETNMMTFNNKDIIDSSSSSNTYQIKFLKNNKKSTSPDTFNNRNKFLMNNLWKIQNEFNSNNNYNDESHNAKIININKKNNFENEIYNNNNNNNINIIHKIKNSSNNNKINNNIYRNINQNLNDSRKISNNNINYNFNSFVNEMPNKNINEHSSDKKNVNKIRKESYHSNQNVNMRNKVINVKQVNNTENKIFSTDSENLLGTEKMKVVTLENSLYTSGKNGSKSNSFHMSDDNNTITSKNDVKNYLKEVKSKLEPERFKKFITQIKALTKNKNNKEKNLIILQIKNLLIDKNLIYKFENIMKVNNN